MYAAGHSEPSLNIPFLMTRELFLLKWGITAEQTDAYIALDAEARRAYLDDELSQLPLSAVEFVNAPRLISELEWFATPPDLCQAMLTLKGQAEAAERSPIFDILSTNPGMQVDPETWPFVGYKGGSEPGLLNLTWLLKRQDERWFFLTFGLSDTEDVFGPFPALGLAHAAFAFLAEHP